MLAPRLINCCFKNSRRFAKVTTQSWLRKKNCVSNLRFVMVIYWLSWLTLVKVTILPSHQAVFVQLEVGNNRVRAWEILPHRIKCLLR
ncbi:hypothetical protein BCR33DRAFT_570998 [Rhizoclosmatium globosum]|uniref:Uncharacterized protein n=1 Tax=Rhizoclosmatium globosum TaxID=329046 RepID=A0A1Y2B5P1_9FUNG|nr:hypothetical protein BCR33DRAFT_570998 [Rhizoclosmatium globosum]|eukprot:ORY30158.1 hypothetical protein BCR33DRAFT_570998 [Rhizoclosmatium globosum]